MKVMISGYGKMGHMVEKCLQERGIECAGASEDITSTDPALAKECVCIDFTTPDAFRSNYKFLAENFKAVVIGTTGWNDIKDDVISYFVKNNTPMIHSSNYSVGVNVLFYAVEYTAKLLKEHGYSSYIEEKHHCHKLDRPSGTAKTLESLVQSALDQNPDMASVRCGEIAGIHEVGFEGLNDRITIRHEAFSRAGFASGAVEAAVIADTLEGVHEFKDIIFNK